MPGPVIPNPTPDWLKPENASVTDTALTKAMRMIGHLIGADNPTAQVLGLMMTDVPGGSATGGLAKAVEGLKARVIKAYHGSPHDFERFSLEQAGRTTDPGKLGKGLYFSTDPNVAAPSPHRYEVALNIQNPLDVSVDKWGADKSQAMATQLGLTGPVNAETLRQALIEKGHDAVRLDYSPLGYKQQEYMVADDRLIDILKKYGLLLPAAGGAGQATISRRSE